jgi:hypothetical protein
VSTEFSASEPMLGYIYQARYALLLLLQREEQSELMIEGLDDITVGRENSIELIQLKHHEVKASLSDSSPELWKTMRVWSEHIANGTIKPDQTVLTLVTTAEAPESSICALLRPNGTSRNSDEARYRLINIAKTSLNESLRKAFDAFLHLSSAPQKAMVQSIYVLDGSPNIQDVAIKIKEKTKYSAPQNQRDNFFNRLQGWWLTKVIDHIVAHANSPITGYEVTDKINQLRAQFLPDALPIDFLDEKPEAMDAVNDDRMFVRQLRAIAIQSGRIEKALIDYYRAFEQRSKWVREDLLVGNELERYESKLLDEWQRFKMAVEDRYEGKELQEAELTSLGRGIYDWAQETADIQIRPGVTEQYVMRGTYHMLADRNPPSIWWHPQFLERLKTVLAKESIE